MVVEIVRWADKFESLDATVQVAFSSYDNQEYEAGQGYRATLESVVGADYGVDYAGAGRWAKDFGQEALRFVIFGSSGAAADTAFDLIAGRCAEIGEGKLWQVDQAGARRWCYAKVAGRPSYRTDVNALTNIPVAVRFLRLSDWYTETATTGNQAITASQTFVTVTTGGNAPVYDNIVLRLDSTAAGGFTNPTIRNLRTGESVRVAVTAAADSRLEINTSEQRVTFIHSLAPYVGAGYIGASLVVGGAVAGDVFDRATLGNDAAALFHLEPGANVIEILSEGTPAATFSYSFYGGWH